MAETSKLLSRIRSGETLIGTRGFRASKARIIALRIPKSVPIRLLTLVARNYPDVPLFAKFSDGIDRNVEELRTYTANEVFLAGTAAEVVPVAEYDKRLIGCGEPGPVSKKLIAAFRNLVQTTGTPIY